MTALIPEAAELLAPLLAAGGTTAATGAVERGGSQLYDKLLATLRGRTKGRDPAVTDVEAALRNAVEAGEVTIDDLRALLAIQARTIQTGAGNTAVQIDGGVGGSVFNGPVSIRDGDLNT